MKLISFILAFLFVGLNLWPCNDTIIEDSCGSEVHYHASDNQDKDSDSDHCSPFCQCYCCHIQVEYAKATDLSSERTFVSVKRAFICTRAGQKFTNALFEPPQV